MKASFVPPATWAADPVGGLGREGYRSEHGPITVMHGDEAPW
jgi:hypothetical protein